MAAEIDNATHRISHTRPTPFSRARSIPSQVGVRFWDYSQMPSSRIPRKSLKTLDRKFSTREKIRFSSFTFISLLCASRLQRASEGSLAALVPLQSPLANSKQLPGVATGAMPRAHSYSIHLSSKNQGQVPPNQQHHQNLLDTLSDPTRIGILSGATRAKDLSGIHPIGRATRAYFKLRREKMAEEAIRTIAA